MIFSITLSDFIKTLLAKPHSSERGYVRGDVGDSFK